MSVKIFFCYAHADEDLLMKLKIHLSPLLNQGLIDVWHDRNISAGTDWEQEIKEQLNAAQIILLLVSPDFMASNYINNVELKRAIERHQRGEARVIPIIVRPVYWQEGILGQLQALPTDGKPVMSSLWQYQDEAYVNVTKGIRKVVEEITTKPSLFSQTLPIQPSKPEPTGTPANVLNKQTRKPEPLVTPEVFSWHCIRTLTGHTDSVFSVAISPDGQTLASGSGDHSIKLWNVKTGDLLRTLTGHKDSVESVAISPDGQMFASGSGDHSIKLWNVKTGNFLRTLTRLGYSNSNIALSPDGQTLASGGFHNIFSLIFVNNPIKLWNVKTGDLLHTLTGHTDSVCSVAISPDGQTLASGSFDNTIKLWNVKAGDLLRTLTGHTDWVFSVAFRPDGQTLASGSRDNTIKLWDLVTGQELRTLTGHTDWVFSVAFRPDGQTLASGSRDNTIKLWGEK